ncbi:MAG: hypothetical protein ACOYMA_15530 [Bacteroidia bacterium]
MIKFDLKEFKSDQNKFIQNNDLRSLLETYDNYFANYPYSINSVGYYFPIICFIMGRLRFQPKQISYFIEKHKLGDTLSLNGPMFEFGLFLYNFCENYPDMDEYLFRKFEVYYNTPKYFEIIDFIIVNKEIFSYKLDDSYKQARNKKNTTFSNELLLLVYDSHIKNKTLRFDLNSKIYHYDKSLNIVQFKHLTEHFDSVNYYIDFELRYNKLFNVCKELFGEEFEKKIIDVFVSNNYKVEYFEIGYYYNSDAEKFVFDLIEMHFAANEVEIKNEEFRLKLATMWLLKINQDS